MNNSTAVFLINDNVRAIQCTYEEGESAKREVFKTFDKSIEVDDFVIVESGTRHKMTVVKVVEVDVDIDLESSTKVLWVIDAIDTVNFDDTLIKEQKALDAIHSAQKRKRRKELQEAILADQEETLKALPIAHMGELKE